jgi:hypothetical protein
MAYGVIVYDSRTNQGEGEFNLPREALVDALLAAGATAREQGWYYITRHQGFVKVELPAGELRYMLVECPNVTRASFALAGEALAALATAVPGLEVATPGSGKTLPLTGSAVAEIASFLMEDWRSNLSCSIITLRRE